MEDKGEGLDGEGQEEAASEGEEASSQSTSHKSDSTGLQEESNQRDGRRRHNGKEMQKIWTTPEEEKGVKQDNVDNE